MGDAITGETGAESVLLEKRDGSVVILTFNEPAIALGTQLAVTGPSGLVSSGDPRLVDNTVTWQYRYDYRSRADYSPAAAQQLMASLVSQMRYVQDSRR